MILAVQRDSKFRIKSYKTDEILTENYQKTRLNAFTRSFLFNATAVAAQCHSQQTNFDSLARRHNQVRNV